VEYKGKGKKATAHSVKCKGNKVTWGTKELICQQH